LGKPDAAILADDNVDIQQPLEHLFSNACAFYRVAPWKSFVLDLPFLVFHSFQTELCFIKSP